MKKSAAYFTLLLIFALFIASVIVNNRFLDGFRVDLTQGQVYTLSDGSRSVIKAIEEPINLYFFFSDSATKGMTGLRNYAERVESLLREYEKLAPNKISIQVIDPKPFSEAEDQAAQFGLTGASLGALGESVYFGLAGTNGFDDQGIISFFDPQKEAFLEYDISKLIYQLSDPAPVKVTIVSDLPLAGGQNPMTGQASPPMVFLEQLKQLYDVEIVSAFATELPVQTDVLMLANVTAMAPELHRAVDQFAMQNGSVIVLADPFFESDPFASMQTQPSETMLSSLLQAWGVRVNNTEVVLDGLLGLEIRESSGAITRHPGMLGIYSDNMDANDIVTTNLDIINGASFGHIETTADATLSMLELLRSSSNAVVMPVEQYRNNTQPNSLLNQVAPDAPNKQYTLAARFTGPANAYYTDQVDTVNSAAEGGSTLNLLVVADADLLTDRFWVQQSSFFGQNIFTPFASNGDLIINAVDNLAGSDGLISIRSRGKTTRPFTKVQQLEAAAAEKYRAQEQQLQQQLSETEAALAELQGQQTQAGSLVLSAEQQAAIDDFIAKRIEIRKALREVKFQLEGDITALGNKLKIANVVVSPLVLVLLLWLFSKVLRRRAKTS